MDQKDYPHSSQPEIPEINTSPTEPLSENSTWNTGRTGSAAPFFPVVGDVTFKQAAEAREQEARRSSNLPVGMVSLISAIGLCAALLGPLSSCDTSRSSLPCPAPTPTPEFGSTGTWPQSDDLPTATCRTSSGTRYVWVRNRGGWVKSDDGIHPNPGERGVGVNEGHSSSTGKGGVGDGHSGGSHGS